MKAALKALRRNKSPGVHGILTDLFQAIKIESVKILTCKQNDVQGVSMSALSLYGARRVWIQTGFLKV